MVSLDANNAKRGLDGGAGISPGKWASTYREALSRVGELLAAGCSVVVDDTNCFRFLRDDYRQLAQRHGVATTVVHVKIGLEVALQRVRQNTRSRLRPGVREAVLLELAEKFEEPDAGEAALTYSPDEAPEAWARRLLPPPRAVRPAPEGSRLQEVQP